MSETRTQNDRLADSIPPPRMPRVSAAPVFSDEDSHESVVVYAALTGFAAALPVPFASEWLAGLVRGAAFRRVAQRHGVGLSLDARAALSKVSPPFAKIKGAARLATFVFGQLTRPVRILSRADDTLAAVLSAVLFDHYLRSKRTNEGAIGASEARRLRAALDEAIRKSSSSSLMSVPVGIAHTAKRSWENMRDQDMEGRSAPERFLDTWLDAMADAPEAVVLRAREAFDEALAKDTAE